jgi:hypothetical protein
MSGRHTPCGNLRRQAGFAGLSPRGHMELDRDLAHADNRKANLQEFMERTGIEPVTSGLQSSAWPRGPIRSGLPGRYRVLPATACGMYAG